ncbi:ankyrin repeat-containing domain protein [Daldinia vernicosa]|uniref:ankyrin repeat-containing domain protein n=1 Tax=Daldinia vernicosa TaxID=114800 RepID=UPI002008B1A1|nr:ankyrin repeat-containing domain protein [Daldinia vernicosa]KAI0852910.1 ankyrin repeat-containing domain protein [Daldinia vernicosa]
MDTTPSVIAILQLSLNVMRYIHDIRDGGKEISELTAEVLSVYKIALGIKYDFDSHDLEDEGAWPGPIKLLFEHGATIRPPTINIKDINDNVFRRIGNLRWPKKLEKLIAIVATARKLLSTEALAQLLDDGRVSIESMSSSGQTALSLAASKGYLSIVELLLDRGANLDTGDMYGGPPPLRALNNNRLEYVRLLIERDANYRLKDSLGRAALHACAIINKRGVMRKYLLKNLDLDQNVQGDGGSNRKIARARGSYRYRR